MVDVHPPDFFALGLSIKTPPRDRRKRRNGRKRPRGIMAVAMGPPPHKSTRGLGGPSVYATHIKITGFSIVKIKRVTVSYF